MNEKSIFKITLDKNKYRPVPDGTYKVRLIDIKDGERGTVRWHDIFIFVWEISDGDFSGIHLNDYVNKKEKNSYGATTKFFGYVYVLTGQKEGALMSDSLIGKECLAHIELRQGERIVNRIYSLESIDGQRHN